MVGIFIFCLLKRDTDRQKRLLLLLKQAIAAAIVWGMKTSDVMEHFGSQYATAKALGIKQPSVARWGQRPPKLRQLQIQQITGGKLKAEPDCLLPAEAKPAQVSA